LSGKHKGSKVDVRIINILGQEIEVTTTENGNEIVINTSDLKTGIYFLVISSNTMMVSYKLWKSY